MAVVTMLANFAESQPSGLWESIIYWIESGVKNYGWTIILFTILLKIVLSPTEFYIKYSSKKTTLIQKKLSPQVAKLQKKYGNNQNALNMQMNSLYKKEGLNMVASCFVMLLNLVLTTVIFLTVFTSMRNISAYKMLSQYSILEEEYNQTIVNGGTQQDAEKAVVAKYDEIKDSFIWIKSVWRPDSWVSTIPTYDELSTSIKNSKKEYKSYLNDLTGMLKDVDSNAENYDEKVTDAKNKSVEQYEKIMSPIREENSGWNGYLILVVLAAVLSYLSQKLTEKHNDIKGVKDPQTPQTQSLAIMKFVLPAIMVVFVLTSSAAFGLYILASSATGILTSVLINIFVKKSTAKLEEETKEVLVKEQLKITR